MNSWEITVFGLVQGVGFRPFVAEAARELSLSGTVWNAGGIVKVRAAGDAEALERLVRRLSSCSIPGARVDRVEIVELLVEAGGAGRKRIAFSTDGKSSVENAMLPPARDRRDNCMQQAGTLEQLDKSSRHTGEFDQNAEDGSGDTTSGFTIRESGTINLSREVRFLPADLATCEGCERELLDPNNRRFRYPFISCVSCGPRFSVMEAVPYDRERTSMRGFALCEDCRADYTRVGDIRRHAQTIACEVCGPQVRLGDRTGDEAVREAERLLKAGRILAVKDIGGYHFCFDPFCEEAAERLRSYKNRERKPLAVMFPDTESVREFCELSGTEERLLTSPARPIVLLDKKSGKDFAPSVCGESRQIGAMLPCNPLQILLLNACGPLVMTSGNRGGEPIVTDDEKMHDSCRTGFPDAVLSHDRPIVNGLDDSIFQVLQIPEVEDGPGEYIQILRRARGLVPEPVPLPFELEEDVLAAGGDLKAVFALGRKNMAYLSGHFGDLEEVCAAEAREEGRAHMEALLGIEPTRFICDRHPGYVSVKKLPEAQGVQHHHAHILSVMAEKGLVGPLIGVAFDGTGYGDDGTIWGSEFLVCEGTDYRRAGHFSAITMPGGDTTSRDARISLNAYLAEAESRELLTADEVREAIGSDPEDEAVHDVVISAIRNGVNTVKSSSMGRLFDAVAALLGIRNYNSFEGECAQALQTAAENWADEQDVEVSGYMPEVWAPVTEQGVDSVYLFAVLVKQKLYGTEPGELAFAFHAAVADATAELCARLATESDRLTDVALSGGTMCNRLLLKRLLPDLHREGLTTYLNERVPCGDGGLALGQLMLAKKQNI